MKTLSDREKTVTFDDSDEMARKVFDAVIKWCVENEAFDGCRIMQCDRPQENAAPFLAELADDVVGFRIEWK